MSRAAVLGRPVAHSLSPVLHRAAYAALGLTDWTYDALDIGAEDLPVLLAGLGEEWRGFSVTMPCKQAAVDVADVVEPLPRLLHAANTLVRTEAGWRAENTDVGGIGMALQLAGVEEVDAATIIGAGGTAAAAAVALASLGAEHVDVVVRDPARAGDVARVLGRARRAGHGDPAGGCDAGRAAGGQHRADRRASRPAGTCRGGAGTPCSTSSTPPGRRRSPQRVRRAGGHGGRRAGRAVLAGDRPGGADDRAGRADRRDARRPRRRRRRRADLAVQALLRRSRPCSWAVVLGPWLARVAARLAARDEHRAADGPGDRRDDRAARAACWSAPCCCTGPRPATVALAWAAGAARGPRRRWTWPATGCRTGSPTRPRSSARRRSCVDAAVLGSWGAFLRALAAAAAAFAVGLRRRGDLARRRWGSAT